MLIVATIPLMKQILTLCVIGMLLIAGCSSAPNASNDPTADSNSVTYTNDSGNSTFEMAVDHNSETYDMNLESTLEPDQTEFTRNASLTLLCGVLEQGTYNRSNVNDSADDSSGYTKTTANGETTEVDTIPEDVFEYEPEDVTGATYAQNGSELDSCTINGVGDIDYSR